jgi:hypothetical protein
LTPDWRWQFAAFLRVALKSPELRYGAATPRQRRRNDTGRKLVWRNIY